MMDYLKPQVYGLPVRTKILRLDKDLIGIEKIVKSRIILKDAQKIVAVVTQIKQLEPGVEVALLCTRNICSKSIALFEKEQISIIYQDEYNTK